MPRISRYPSALTPVAIRQCTFTVRPPSRTFWVSASIQQNVYGPRSSGRFRKPSTSSSSSAAIALTCDLDRPDDAEGGGELLHPPGRDAQQVAGRHDRGQRPLGPAAVLQEPREVRPGPQLGDRQLDRPGPGVPLPPPVPVAGVHPVRRDLPVPRVARGPRRRRPSSAGRTPGSSPAARPGSPMPGSPRTARREPAQCHLRPLRSPSLLRNHFEGSRGGRLASRRHAVLRQLSHTSTGYPIHHFRGRERAGCGCGAAGQLRGGWWLRRSWPCGPGNGNRFTSFLIAANEPEEVNPCALSG